MATCTRCRVEIPPGIFAYEGDDGSALCARCFGAEAPAPRPRGRFLLRALSAAFRICSVAGLAGGAAIARLAPPGDRITAGAGLVLGVAVFLACLAAAELIRLGLSVESSLDRLSRAVERIGGALHGG